MKKSILASAALLLLFSLFSCNKDNDSNTFFRCKIDGASFKAEDLLAYGVEFSSELTFYGVKDQSGSESVYISVPLGAKAGTYVLKDGDYDAYYVDATNSAFSTNWGDSQGSLTIEEIDDTHARGTFNFTAYDAGTETVKKTVTEGEFNVKFR